MSTIRHSLLLLLMLSQAMFMAAGGSLVLCSETGSRSQFELLSGNCCEIQELGYQGESRLGRVNPMMELSDRSDCGGCEDRGFAVAALERHRCPVPAARLAEGVWNTPSFFEYGSLIGTPCLGVTCRKAVTCRMAMGRDPGSGLGLLRSVVQRC